MDEALLAVRDSFFPVTHMLLEDVAKLTAREQLHEQAVRFVEGADHVGDRQSLETGIAGQASELPWGRGEFHRHQDLLGIVELSVHVSLPSAFCASQIAGMGAASIGRFT